MTPLLNRLKLLGSILSIKVVPTGIVALDSFYNFYEINEEDFRFQKSIRISKTHEVQHKFSKNFAISKNGHIICALNKTTKGIVLKVENTLEKIMPLTWHKADISNSSFSRDGRYLATGGEDGRTLVYQIPSFNLLTTLMPRPDYICSIAFSPDSALMAVSCFDRTTVVFNVKRNLEITSFITQDIVEDLGFFDRNERLFFACKNGTTGIFDIVNREITSEERHFSQWITRIALTSDGNYAYIGTRENILYLVRTHDNAPLTSITTEHIGISALDLEDKRLYIGYADGYIEILELERGVEEFEAYLNLNDIAKAKELAEEKNIFLKTRPLYMKKINELWKGVLKEAIELLARDKFQDALALVSPFVEDPVKKEEFSYYTEQKEFVAQFLDAIGRSEIAEAYKVAQEHPEILKLSAYEKLEEYWRKTFDACKKILAANAIANLPRAQELLKPFANVRDKKESVYTLLHNSDKYVTADSALKERNYVDYFRLCEKFPFLKDTEAYKKTYLLGQQLVEKIALLENTKEFDKALDVAKFLGSLAPFKSLGIERTRLIERKRNFLEAYNSRDLKKAYKLAEQEENLKSLPEFIHLLDQFASLHEQAHALASKGLSSDVLKLLHDYMEIPYWEDKIASTMKVSYLYEIKTMALRLSPEEVNWKKSLEAYIERFSKDDELVKVCETSGIINYLNEIPGKGDVHGYQKYSYLSSIIVHFDEA